MSWAGKTPTKDEWRDILERHARWFRGNGGERANLQSADLRSADLQSADLRFADLRSANLRSADLRSANLRSANLQSANLQSADLQSADLQSANLRFANMQSANLQSADLRSANLRSADLRSADLQSANLQSANMQSANLRSADLRFANLQSANLQSVENGDLAFAMTRILPEGDLIGWKKCDVGVIVKLRIPAEAKRSHAFGRKCRAEFADVLEVIGAEVGTTDRRSQGGARAEYRAGQRATPDSWDEDWTNECSHGIHFYITKLEAENH